jgi:hypothetical protein
MEFTEDYEVEYNKAKQKYDLIRKFVNDYKNLYTGNPEIQSQHAIRNVRFHDMFKKKLFNALNKLEMNHRDEMFNYESLIRKTE